MRGTVQCVPRARGGTAAAGSGGSISRTNDTISVWSCGERLLIPACVCVLVCVWGCLYMRASADVYIKKRTSVGWND
jgi:hypothetical protein